NPPARARRLASTRAAELARTGCVRRQPLHLPGHVVRRRRQAVPAAGALQRRRGDQGLPGGPLPSARRRRRRASSPPPALARPAWPISYDELEPYYTQAEQMYEVHGARGEDPTEPPASAPYPFPAVSHEPRIQQLADDLEAAGYHPFHAPCGIRLDESNMPYSACVRCMNC